MIGFLHTPLAQTFLSGQFYAIRRSRYQEIFAKYDLNGIPEGIVGEDAFVEGLLLREEFRVSPTKVYYQPPTLDDYCRFLARMRWQQKQLDEVFGELLPTHDRNYQRHLGEKLAARQRFSRTLLGLGASGLRHATRLLFRPRIERYYRDLGPIGSDGNNILSTRTRSHSAK